ncbi:DUF4145 domain-containing protein [Pannonibacter sp. SL95]|uniref:DUF4145 domain-containing protein n=1 Tax=Pannonibacter sp. SL95 TaxID=2995153 RepID=UPI002275B247|nr:DUF4145 domain-containing protein [Pannonibacter sp. SL95]MCY1708405.1 DUF4145 domain-containing protein [Pannonibacter sp. SL95]
MSPSIIPPSASKRAFTCPSCNVTAHQTWYRAAAHTMVNAITLDQHLRNQSIIDAKQKQIYDDVIGENRAKSQWIDRPIHLFKSDSPLGDGRSVKHLSFSNCEHCGSVAVWYKNSIIFPKYSEIQPHPDMPNDVKVTFLEAVSVLKTSPRASSALARLGLEQLCIALGFKQSRLDEKIKALVKSGISTDTQQMLDYIRLAGNDAVHPERINSEDTIENSEILLHFINRICQRLITEPRAADDLYQKISDRSKAAIEKRDSAES